MNQREFWLLFLVLCLLLCIFFYPVLTMQEFFFHEDILGVNLPLRALSAWYWLQGTIPLWNPYCYSGMPLLAEGQAAVFYPLNFIFLLLPTPVANNLLTFLQFVIGALGIALLFKTLKIGFTGSLLGSITYLLNTYFICNINHINIIIVMTLAPFILTFVFRALQHRKLHYFLLSGLFLSLSLLGGIHPSNSHTILAILLILIIHPVKNSQLENKLSSIFFPICGFILLILTAFALSAVQILPSIELTRLSVRAAASGYHQATQYSWEPHFILTVLFPFIWGNPANNTLGTSDFFWEFYAYSGIIPLLLTLFLIKYRRDRLVIIFSSMACLAIILALGRYSPLFFLYKLPFAGLFRAPARFLFLYVLSISMLTGIGLDEMIQRKKTRDHRAKFPLTLAISILILLFAGILLLNQNMIMHSLLNLIESNSQLLLKFVVKTHQAVNLSQFILLESKNILSSLIRFFFLLGIVLFSHALLRSRGASWFFIAIFLIQFLDLYSAGAKLNPTTKREFFNQANWAVDQISKSGLIGRVASIHPPHTELSRSDGYPQAVLTEAYNSSMYQDLGRNVPALLHIRALTGDSPLILRNYHRFLYAALGNEADPLNSYIIWQDINDFYLFNLNRQKLSTLVQKNRDLLNLANATYLLSKDRISEGNCTLVSEDGPFGLKIYRNSQALPRARFVQNAVRVSSPDDALMRYLEGKINPKSATAVAGDITDTISDSLGSYSNSDSTEIHWDKDDALEIKLRIQTQSPGYLVLADNYYPGWKATVDGLKTEIYNADICFRAVQVPAGKHEIRFFYEPASFRWGAYISLCSALLFILLQVRYIVKCIRR